MEIEKERGEKKEEGQNISAFRYPRYGFNSERMNPKQQSGDDTWKDEVWSDFLVWLSL
jgi:hypothetical protein